MVDIEEKYLKRLEANRRYRREHKEVLSEKKKIFYLENRERILAKQRERNAKECDDLRAYRKTLHDEISELIEKYEQRISDLEARLKN